MGDVTALLLSVALPWIAGALCVRVVLGRWSEHGIAISLGYGYLFGLFAVTLVMRLLDAMGVRWTIAAAALPIGALACAAYIRVRLTSPPSSLRDEWRITISGFFALPAATRALFCFLLILTVARAIVLGLEVVWTPLMVYDSWAQWASKARVWYAYGSIVPFVPSPEWGKAVGAMHFTDTHAGYPGTVPLFQVWTAIWLGRWDESLVNVPWAASYVALGIAFYAQARRAGISALKSMFGTYLLLSLPFLTVHVALAGIADIMVAIAYGLAAMALWHWTISRRRSDAGLAFAMAIICAALKVEGIVWVLTLVPAILVALNRRLGFATIVVVGSAVVIFLAFGPSELHIWNYSLRTRFENVSLPLYQHLFVMDNWHLLWYAAGALIVASCRFLLEKALAPMTSTMLAAASIVVIVFYFSSASSGVDDESLINRLILQIVPALVFYLALILCEWSRRSAAAANEVLSAGKPAV